MDSIGFIGTGTMGAPMVHCLVDNGYRPVLYDVSVTASSDAAARDDLQVAPDIAGLAQQASVVILMLPNSQIVRTVCLGNNGLSSALDAGDIIVDMSSSDPVETRKLGAELHNKSITLLDAPVSGGVRKAINASLAIMLGGNDESAMAQVNPILESLGTVFKAGSLGAGHATKALNNYVSAAGLAAACEALIIGREFGLDPARMTDIINASTGRNNSTENKIAQFVLSGDFKSAGFGLGLMAKDVALAASLAEHVGRALPGVNGVADTFRAAEQQLDSDADHTEVYRYLNNND